MANFILVELDSGEQEFFERPYDAFKYAKEKENLRHHSVEYLAIGNFYTEPGVVYRGQELRHLLRSLDNTHAWIKAQLEKTDEETYE